MSGMELPFRGYDVRGIYPSEIDEALVYKAAFSLANFSPVVVGHDCREGSRKIYRALLDGLADAGALVYDVGEVPTPVLSFVSKKTRSFGIMVTASHNPPEYTGLKFFKEGRNLIAEELEALKGLNPVDKREDGEIIEVDAIPHYVQALEAFFHDIDGKIYVDHGGWEGKKSAEILRKFVRVKEIGGEHGPLPISPPAVGGLALSTDGDADRSMFSLNGTWLNPASLIIRFAEVLNVKQVICDWILPRKMDIYIKTLRTKVGTPNLVEAHIHTGIPLAGELSSHFWYFPFNGHSDPVFFTLLLVKYGVGELVDMPRTVSRKYQEPPEVLLTLGKREESPEGVEVLFKGHRVMGRRSNTEPVTRVYVQGENPESVLKEVEKYLGLTPV